MNHIMTRLMLQLAVVIISSKILGHLFSRVLKQSRVLGELVAGMVIGSYALVQKDNTISVRTASGIRATGKAAAS